MLSAACNIADLVSGNGETDSIPERPGGRMRHHRRRFSMSSVRNMHQGIERQLRDKRDKIITENNDLMEFMRQNRELEPDLADRASTASSQDWNMIRYNRNQRLLKDINAALKAIDNDAYGLCELCGEHIADRRLLAMPGARFCIECQEMVDANPGEFGRNGIGILAAV
jgi:DnaK suppressor protein